MHRSAVTGEDVVQAVGLPAPRRLGGRGAGQLPAGQSAASGLSGRGTSPGGAVRGRPGRFGASLRLGRAGRGGPDRFHGLLPALLGGAPRGRGAACRLLRPGGEVGAGLCGPHPLHPVQGYGSGGAEVRIGKQRIGVAEQVADHRGGPAAVAQVGDGEQDWGVGHSGTPVGRRGRAGGRSAAVGCGLPRRFTRGATVGGRNRTLPARPPRCGQRSPTVRKPGALCPESGEATPPPLSVCCTVRCTKKEAVSGRGAPGRRICTARSGRHRTPCTPTAPTGTASSGETAVCAFHPRDMPRPSTTTPAPDHRAPGRAPAPADRGISAPADTVSHRNSRQGEEHPG